MTCTGSRSGKDRFEAARRAVVELAGLLLRHLDEAILMAKTELATSPRSTVP